jgi:hypothetical protein
VSGGGGIYHRNQQFTQPSIATLTAFDPFFGGFLPVTVPTTEILSSYSVNKPGVDFGAGVAFGTKWRGKFFRGALQPDLHGQRPPYGLHPACLRVPLVI